MLGVLTLASLDRIVLVVGVEIHINPANIWIKNELRQANQDANPLLFRMAHPWWDNQRGWKNLLNNLRLVIEPWIAFNRLKPWLTVFFTPTLEQGFAQLIEQMRQFYCPIVQDVLLRRILFNSA